MKTSTDTSHRPGAISAFFIYKAGLFAACFWTWLGVLAFREVPVTGWHVVAATGAGTSSVIGVVLGIRFALQRDASERHQEIMRTLVEITWHTFAATPPSHDRDSHEGHEGEADVIRLAQDIRRARR